ncbi:hypothetical protein FGG08_002162 [Glutinoglossum americanum]|uniref:Uncharacterized protein n=1 Tax=Glutinoglossum americanum TaxID=1670608 RepID=A0A9P8I0L8_9PEZI|nr:hypothetical protein FGG08_002162 [Glutinoglossum americanum]
MPIKIPKGFGRRKSTDKVLEEVENTPEPSFRVFERPAGGSKSLDAGNRLKIFSGTRPEIGPNSKSNRSRDFAEDERGISNRGSGASNTNSSSTGGYHDNSSSSARLSSSSTLPSSTDAQTPEETFFPRSQKPLPIPPIPQTKPAFSLTAGGRTFSFGAKAPKPAIPASSGSPRAIGGQYQFPHNGDSSRTSARDRAMTESSYASTTTPPKLDTELGSSDIDGFGNMFEGFGKRKSTMMEGGEPKTPVPPTPPSPLSPTTLTRPPKTYSNSRLSHATPPPPAVSINSRDIESSPYSWGSRNSNDGLMSSPGIDEGPQTPRHGNIRALTPSSTAPVQTPPSGLLGGPRPHRLADGGLKRSSAYGMRRPSIPIEDEDAKLVMDSVNATRQLNRQSVLGGPKGHADRLRDRDNVWDRMTSTSSDNSVVKSSNQSSDSSSGGVLSPVGTLGSRSPDLASGPPRRPISEIPSEPARSSTGQVQEDAFFDPAIASSAKLAAQFEEHLNSPERQAEQKKVMTPAQFERYRQQQETRSKFDASKSDTSDDDDDGDDEDEAERNRQAAKQRKKQEAHLTVYRQQMMKVTGEQSSSFPSLGQMHSGPNVTASSSAPNLLSGGLSTINLNGDKDEGKESDDSDEDIPLAILAAHGFPNKNRPPTMLMAGSSTSNFRPLSQVNPYPPPPRSVAGESVAAGSTTGKLPVFARNLPRDPYFGASLVNPSNRESLAFSHNGGGSVYGGSPGPSGLPPSGLPPGGLVGVIASEERSRAMRRGSPNSAAFNRSGSPGAGLLGMGAGAGVGPQGMGPMPGMGGMGGIGGVGQMGPMPGMNMGMGMGMGMGGMGGMPMMAPGDQVQLQMSQQMTQMMQMQVQWMEKMMQMQQLQSGQPQSPQPSPQPGSGNGFLGVPGQMGSPPLMDSNSIPQIHQRTMSMLDPGSSQWNNQTNFRNSTYAPSINNRTPGYTPSIAPSERSTVGLPSRYRPVSQNPAAAPSNRASTFTAGTLSTWQEKRATLSQTKMQKAKGEAKNDDEDDDQGWEEMKKKREKKKSHWKLKNDSNVLNQLFFTGN